MSTPVRLYPIRDRWLTGVPTAVQVIETKGEADDLIATGAFTDNPNDAARDHDAPDLSGDPVTFAPLSFKAPRDEDVVLVKPRPVEALVVPQAPETEPAKPTAKDEPKADEPG